MAHNLEIDFIIKLGGGAVTHKYDFETAKLDEIKEVTQLLKKCHQAGLRFVVVHGAGSFGHFQAKQYSVEKGYSNKSESDAASVIEGFCKTRLSVTKLNHMIVQAFEEEGLPAVALSCVGTWKTKNKMVTQDGVDSVLQLLAAGLIPVTHGDVVLDSQLGCAILSGDTITEVLSTRLNPRRVIFLSDVEGIYDRPPEEEGAQLIPQISVRADGKVDVPIATSMALHDVTGGIQLKIASAVRILQHGHGAVAVFICAIDSDAAVKASLEGSLGGLKGTELFYNNA